MIDKFGPEVVDGCLCFRLLDGSRIVCECIKEPHASMVVQTFHGPLTPLFPPVENLDDASRQYLQLISESFRRHQQSFMEETEIYRRRLIGIANINPSMQIVWPADRPLPKGLKS